eukprot:Hpha_TRINITY_DN14422_c0_g1::TRINITY_DN14422_c0_g1_i1::g.157199::m.157199
MSVGPRFFPLPPTSPGGYSYLSMLLFLGSDWLFNMWVYLGMRPTEGGVLLRASLLRLCCPRPVGSCCLLLDAVIFYFSSSFSPVSVLFVFKCSAEANRKEDKTNTHKFTFFLFPYCFTSLPGPGNLVSAQVFFFSLFE